MQKTGDSDTDGDGLTFAQELANGTNPLMADGAIEGPVRFADGGLAVYNPNGYGEVVIRSEPEGALFATTREIYRPGTRGTTGVYSPANSRFAYWSFNGARVADAWGRAADSVGFTADGHPMEIVAVTAADNETRMKLYWYGTTGVAMTSDTDGDGMTFAQELANGTNPLMADGAMDGPVRFADGGLLQYNPFDYQPYTLRSEPEGVLFPTTNFYIRAGSKVTVEAQGATFAYWVLNGTVQRDAWERAKDAVVFTMPHEAVTVVAVSEADYETRMKLYWYGTTDVAMTSDTDGDGLTFAEELAQGTNPLMADGAIEGPVRWADSELLEANLQPYEQIVGAVVDGAYCEFASLLGGGAAAPVVVDLDGDGLFDIVVEDVAGGTKRVYLNCGSSGNPQFASAAWRAEWADAVAAARLASLDGLAVDVRPDAAVGWTMAGADLLVSDAEGRIWFYKAQGDGWTLQHKVWGGSYPGFAEGLRIAALDWDDDGDWDCLCGTADGRLLLLRNPKVGRPTNVSVSAGVDSVRLEWDPNPQSRIRGYKVYRKAAEGAEDYDDFVSPCIPLPRYVDYPPVICDYNYKVSSISRFYTAGNSTPIVSESPTTEAVRAAMGRVELRWNDAVAKVGGEVTVTLSIGNSMGLSTNGLAFAIGYDESKLRLKKRVPGALLEVEKIPAGSGRIMDYVFEVVASAACETAVRLESASARTVAGSAVTVTLPPKDAVVRIEAAANPAYVLGDVDGDGDVDKDDLRLLAKLKEGNRKWNANQLKAGDFNGNGRLDNADFQALREMLREKGVL